MVRAGAERASRIGQQDRVCLGSGSSGRFAVAVVGAVLVSALFLAWLAFGLGGAQVTQGFDDTGEGVASLIAGIACMSAAARERGRIRWGWSLLGGSALSWTAGEAIWSWYEVFQGREVPFPSLADVGYLLAVPLALAGIVMFFAPPVRLTSRLLAIVDALIVGAGMLLISWLTVLEPVYRGGTGSVFARAIGLAYPVGDVVILSVVVVVSGRSRSPVRVPFAWIAAALAALALSDSAFAYLTTEGAYDTGQLVDAGWVVGFLILALAAIKPPARRVRWSRKHERTLLPYVPVLVASTLLGTRIARDQPLGQFGRVAFLLILLLLVFRQVLTLRENASLTHDLEAKVQLRTVELRTSEQRLRSLIQNISDVISVVSTDGTITFTSPSVRDMLGYTGEELAGSSLFDLVHPEDRAKAAAFLGEPPHHTGAGRRVKLRMLARDGQSRYTETIAGDGLDEAIPNGFVLTTRDVSDQKKLEQQLEHQAFHDPLTDLANRSLFTDRVHHALARTARSGQQLAVVFIDLDDFKSVNDTLGHGLGDELLQEVASRLIASARPGDTVARLGGDEFAILLEDCDEESAIQIAERFRQSVAMPIALAKSSLLISASSGIAIGGPTTESMADLLRNADIAMYRAKAKGKAGYEVFRTEMREAVVRRVGLQGDLQHALERRELELYYQPLVELCTNRLVGFEALCRWRHPTRGLVSPADFIPVAEETGLIIPIGRWVLQTAVDQLAYWDSLGDGTLTMSINVSGRQFMNPGFVGQVERILNHSTVSPSRVTLELTESILLRDVDETVARLQQLKTLGVRLAIDDFGTGFSSLAYLQRFPIDALKIDKSFVDQMLTSNRAAELARSIVTLGDVLGLDTIAEGIELDKQASQLEATGCHLGQGYLFGHPLSAALSSEFVRSPRATPHGTGSARPDDRTTPPRSSTPIDNGC